MKKPRLKRYGVGWICQVPGEFYAGIGWTMKHAYADWKRVLKVW